MCLLEAGYTTLVGPEYQIKQVVERWDDLHEALDRLGLSRPSLMSLRDFGTHFQDDRCPAVAVVWHDPRLGHQAADELQTELLTALEAPNVLCEPGYAFHAASTDLPAAGRPSVTLHQNRIQQTRAQLSTGAGSSVAVIDSGDQPGRGTMIDFLGGQPNQVNTDDMFGHGYAVSELIRTLRPNASIEPVRVLNAAGRADSYNLFLALIYCLWPGTFDVVNASLTNEGVGQCATSLGRSLTFILRQCQQNGKGAATTLVAAAGNTTSAHRLGYPARLPTAVIAIGLDWSGNDAGYNVPIATAGATVQSAYGGTSSHPFGQLVDPRGNQHPIYGTSFAAAVVTASYLN